MQKLFRCLGLAVALAGVAWPAAAGELTIQIANGRATVVARDVPLRQILAEWARVGETRVVNAEKLAGGPITLELRDVPEKDALDILLRSAAGYVAAPRAEAGTGASLYDRVLILATSRPPAAAPAPPPQPFNRQVFTQPQPLPDVEDDDDGEPGDQGPVPPPGMVPPGMMPPGAPFPPPSGADPNEMPQQPLPITAPRPGLLPQPVQPSPGNPYAPPTAPPGFGQGRPGAPVQPDPQDGPDSE